MMITIKHLEIYKSYGGNGDYFVRLASKKEQALMDNECWSLINGFIQDFQMIRNGLTSKCFSENLCKKITEKCENEETITQLKLLAV